MPPQTPTTDGGMALRAFSKPRAERRSLQTYIPREFKNTLNFLILVIDSPDCGLTVSADDATLTDYFLGKPYLCAHIRK